MAGTQQPVSKALLLLSLLALSLVCVAQAETCHTYVNNQSSKTVLGTLSCAGFVCKSKFNKREIAPGKSDGDEYSAPYGRCLSIGSQGGAYKIWMELQVKGAMYHNSVHVKPDYSILLKDGRDNGVDVFQSVYGDLNKADGPAILTIFP